MCELIEFDNGQYVADIKYKYIRNIAEAAKECKNISRIVLFGSAAKTVCTNQSDIDIAVFGKQTKNEYLKSDEFKKFHRKLFSFGGDFSQDYDIIYFCDGIEYSDRIFTDIKNGAEIYRRA